jgi:two-component system cell cycle sensor histidine kinase/response regulator CckA
VGILGVTRDISERKLAEKEKEQLQIQLERSKKMEWLGLIAGGVAHDLNNVLSGIVSYPDLLLMDLPQNSPMAAPIQTIRESGLKAATIVQDLLALARRGVVSREIINLNSLIDDYEQSPEHIKIMSYHPNIRVAFSKEPNLPNMLGSPVHLKKALMNLVANAAEAQPNGGKIVVSTQSRYLEKPIRGYDTVIEGDYIVLTVEDSGEGIKQKDLERIFEPFFTKKSMGRSGTGLGLAVVWGTVQDHRGYINVSSETDRGTCFELFFPLSRMTAPEQKSRIDFDSLKGHGEKILIVDDVASQREIASNILERLNYTVFTAESGEAALEFIQNNRVDLVVLDMIMDPGIDGLETYQRILQVIPDLKAIITSGFAETGRVKEAQRIGASTYLKKPYMLDSLGKAVQRGLSKQT